MKNAIIVGASGFGGHGLIRILLGHPGLKIKQLIDIKDSGRTISSVYPHLRGYCDMIVDPPEKTDYNNADIAFFSTPDRAGMSIIKDFYEKNIPVIDFSGDFRFKTMEEYRVYARNKSMDDSHKSMDLLEHSVYGLPEINAEAIKKSKIVGNPGCFAASMLLGLLPAAQEKIILGDTIICDGKTGVSGAGKNPGESNSYPQRYENVNTYRETKHQHIVEVENVISSVNNKTTKILFVPQIVPMNRGILMTIYADVKKDMKTKELLSLYENYYRDKPFIVVTGNSPNTADVRDTNRCEIKPMIDERTGKLIVISVIDNLMKGQSGNAVQNANLMLGLDETAGLNIPPFYP